VFAPHDEQLEVGIAATVEDVCDAIRSKLYLPTIDGGRATWMVRIDGTPVGVIAQQWSASRVFTEDVKIANESNVHCAYMRQEDPASVFLLNSAQA